MDIEIRVYVKQGDLMTSRTMRLDEGELDAMISAFLKYNGYVSESEVIDSIAYEGVNF
jgi:DNA-directed RNA polymerase alpha subunit